MPEVHFILVEPAVPENIGSSARAIKTMGFSSLRLINPADHLSKGARKLAYGSHDILENAQVFGSLEEAVSDLDFTIGTTAKKRIIRKDYHDIGVVPDLVLKKGATVKQLGVIFGREESGLDNDELKYCDILSSIPYHGTYPSLNLSQSVMLYAYELSKTGGDSDFEVTAYQSADADPVELNVLKEKAKNILLDLGFEEESNIYRRMLERLMTASEDDIHLLLSFHKKLKRRLDRKK